MTMEEILAWVPFAKACAAQLKYDQSVLDVTGWKKWARDTAHS